jgi:hypothetical protein
VKTWAQPSGPPHVTCDSSPYHLHFFAHPGPVPHWVHVADYERHQPEKTLLYEVVREKLESFLSNASEQGAPVARFVEREIRGYLDCGILARGFLRLHCDACGRDRLLAFSCKGRALCPSCGGRRMADTAAYLVDCVLPEVPVRQWVLTLPYPLRYRCAYDAKLTSCHGSAPRRTPQGRRPLVTQQTALPREVIGTPGVIRTPERTRSVLA